MATAIASVGQKSLVVLCFVLVQFSSHGSARWLKSSIDTTSDWTFITRFCFLSEDGGFEYTFKYPKSHEVQQLLLYYDAPGQWESIYKSSKNCTERLSVLSKAQNQIIDLTDQITTSRSAGCSVYTQDGQDYFNCSDTVSFRTARERWWYIALARCDPSAAGMTGLQLEYEMHMTNGPSDDYLHHELSADEFYILPVDITFLLAYAIVLVLSIVCAIKLYDRVMLHTTYKLYIASLSLWMFGLLLQCIAWGRYSTSGWEENPTEVTGRLFQAASTAVILLMLILMAKGYTITRGRLTQMSTARLTIFFCLYIIANILLFVWEGIFFDEGEVLYFYESPPGYGLIAMRLIGWIWFLYAFFFTIKHHPDKHRFYIPFFIFYTVWFWAGPIMILIAIFSMAKWSRRKTVNGVEQFVALCGHLFFLILTRPSAANRNFPYHLRSTQVRFSDNEEDTANTYAMSEESRQHLDNIFVVQRSADHTALPNFSATSNGGYANGGYTREPVHHDGYMKSENGFNPALDKTFTTQRNGESPSSSALTSSLPPLTKHQLPPLNSGTALLTVHSEEETEQTAPQDTDGSQSASLHNTNGTSLPPLPPLDGSSSPRSLLGRGSGGASVLPPLRSGTLPPISRTTGSATE